MKKISAIFVCLALLLSSFSAQAGVCVETRGICGEARTLTDDAPKESELYAKAAVLMDGDSGRVLYGKNETEALANASTTKILTCIIALENCELSQTVEFSPVAASAPKVHLGAAAGTKFRMEDLIYAMMLESFNDCAVAIAEHISGTVEDFSALMNRYAEKIGCADTYFLTPNGLDAQDENGFHHTTAEDLARIMRYCVKLSPKADLFIRITGTESHSFSAEEGGGSYSCTNHNAFLRMMDGAFSGKTGFTGTAGYCYVGALERDGRTYIVALLACGWPNNKTYKWSDAKKLMQYGLEAFSRKDLAEVAPEAVSPILVEDGQGDGIGTPVSVNVRLVQTKSVPAVLLAAGEELSVEYRVAESLTAPVEEGSYLGTVRVTLGGEVLKEYRAQAAESVKKTDYVWCLMQVLRMVL